MPSLAAPKPKAKAGGRAARPFLRRCALTMALIAPAQALPSQFSFDDLLTELAVAIVGALRENDQVRIVGSDTALARDLEARLSSRGVRLAATLQPDVAVVRVTCSHTISERLCAAEVQRGDARELVSVHRHHGVEASMKLPVTTLPAVPLVLELRPLVADTTPILDIALAGRQLFVLHPTALARYQHGGDGWRVQDTRPIVSKRPWPRDLRGRVVAQGSTLEVFLPGLTCRGTVEPFDVACSQDPRAWPIGFENTMPPDRNYFVSPEGRHYYAVAALGAASGARWLAATADGRLVFLDDGRKPLDDIAGSGEDVAGLSTPCASGDLVLVPVRAAAQGHGDALRLFRVAGRRMVPVTPPATFPGTLTALWATGGAGAATAVSHNPMTGLYEAFQVGVACGR